MLAWVALSAVSLMSTRHLRYNALWKGFDTVAWKARADARTLASRRWLASSNATLAFKGADPSAGGRKQRMCTVFLAASDRPGDPILGALYSTMRDAHEMVGLGFGAVIVQIFQSGSLPSSRLQEQLDSVMNRFLSKF